MAMLSSNKRDEELDRAWHKGWKDGYYNCMEGINREGERILHEASMMRSIFSRATKLEEGLKRLIREGEENAN
ncbi:MAG: hypothetical protein ACOCTM_03305 [Bacteroidota bacterium]